MTGKSKLERQVTVHDQLPGAIVANSIQSDTWNCEIISGEVTCSTDILPPVPEVSEIKLGVSSLYTTSLSIANTATVETDSYDPDLSNNLSEFILYQWKWWLPAILQGMLPTP